MSRCIIFLSIISTLLLTGSLITFIMWGNTNKLHTEICYITFVRTNIYNLCYQDKCMTVDHKNLRGTMPNIDVNFTCWTYNYIVWYTYKPPDNMRETYAKIAQILFAIGMFLLLFTVYLWSKNRAILININQEHRHNISIIEPEIITIPSSTKIDGCSICLESLQNTRTIMSSKCSHEIHEKCFVPIIMRCPICRTSYY